MDSANGWQESDDEVKGGDASIVISPSAPVFEQVLAQLHKGKDANQGQLVSSDISTTWRTFAGMIIMIMINTTVIFDSIAVGPGKGSIELTHLMFLLDRPKHDSEV